jgi:hypothetical protein
MVLNFTICIFYSRRNHIGTLELSSAPSVFNFHATQSSAMLANKAFIDAALVNISTLFDRNIF